MAKSHIQHGQRECHLAVAFNSAPLTGSIIPPDLISTAQEHTNYARQQTQSRKADDPLTPSPKYTTSPTPRSTLMTNIASQTVHHSSSEGSSASGSSANSLDPPPARGTPISSGNSGIYDRQLTFLAIDHRRKKILTVRDCRHTSRSSALINKHGNSRFTCTSRARIRSVF